MHCQPINTPVFLQDGIDAGKNYILAIEVANPDGSWPTHVPGDPVGDFERYVALIGRPRYASAATSRSAGASSSSGGSSQHQKQQQQQQQAANADDASMRASFWESELTETLDTVFGGIATELRETSVGIVNTAR
jgi:hypothetical protein